MPIRLRGALVSAGSIVAGAALYYLLFQALSHSTESMRLKVYPFALPLVGLFWGVIELIGGVPLPELNARWNTMPRGRQIALFYLFAFIGIGVVFGLLGLLMYSLA